MVKGKPNDAFDPNAKPKPKRIARQKTVAAKVTLNPAADKADKALRMQAIPKGAPEVKKSAADIKAEKATARKRAKDELKIEPNHYVAIITNDVVKALRDTKEYKDMREKAQQSLIGMIENAAEKGVRKMVQDLAGQGHATVPVKLGAIQFKPDGTVSFSVSSAAVTKACHTASEKIGAGAVLVLVDAAAYVGGEMPKPDKDQPSLHLPQPESDAHIPFEDDEDAELDADFGDEDEEI